jgi:hypothetical protein
MVLQIDKRPVIKGIELWRHLRLVPELIFYVPLGHFCLLHSRG